MSGASLSSFLFPSSSDTQSQQFQASLVSYGGGSSHTSNSPGRRKSKRSAATALTDIDPKASSSSSSLSSSITGSSMSAAAHGLPVISTFLSEETSSIAAAANAASDAINQFSGATKRAVSLSLSLSPLFSILDVCSVCLYWCDSFKSNSEWLMLID
jgi:hypothetical protein